MHAEVSRSFARIAAVHFAGDGDRGMLMRPFTMACLHVHDEASLRLRSFAQSDTAAPVRSRKSSVQQHAMWLFAGQAAGQQVFTELDALTNKTAKTLATSLDKAMRLAASVARTGLESAQCRADAPLWFVHVLVGDGIGTNGAAARILLAHAKASPVAPGFLYFLMLVKCANHQANRVIGGAAEGHAALCGARQTTAVLGSPNVALAREVCDAPKTAPHRHACGTLVRLFKYLMSDYYSDFLVSLKSHVGTLEVVTEAVGAAEGDLRAGNLQALYGHGVVPHESRLLLNAGLDRFWNKLRSFSATASLGAVVDRCFRGAVWPQHDLGNVAFGSLAFARGSPIAAFPLHVGGGLPR